MYTIRILNDAEFDRLPYKYADTALGCADKKKGVAFVRATGVMDWDLKTIEHEVEELVAKTSPHEFDGIRYKGGQPEYNPPPAPRLPTAQELMAQAMAFGKTNYPWTYGARESALSDLARGTEYYKGFQPTDLESSLASQYFQNVWPETERSIRGGMSLSGMEYSPALGMALGRERGNIGTNIGQYLSNLGQARAEYSLGSRLGIAPEEAYGTYLGTDVQQSTNQAQYDWEASVAKSQADYMNAMAKAKQKAAKTQALMMAGGVALGALTGGLAAPGMSMLGGMFAGMPAAVPWALGGASIGGGIGGMLSPLFGGSGEGGGMQDVFGGLNMMSGGGRFPSFGRTQNVGQGQSGGYWRNQPTRFGNSYYNFGGGW